MPSKPFAQSCSDHFFKILHCPSLFYPFFKVYFICGSSFNLLYLVKKTKKNVLQKKRESTSPYLHVCGLKST